MRKAFYDVTLCYPTATVVLIPVLPRTHGYNLAHGRTTQSAPIILEWKNKDTEKTTEENT